MKILISNDDGYQAPGIVALYEALKGLADVEVVAPEHNNSAKSNALSLHSPLYVHTAPNGFRYVNGTPADCVHIALTGLLGYRPDLVVSGINNGANMGDDTIYSGTVGAAMEGYLFGIPALAFSQTEKGWGHLDTAAQKAADLVARHQALAALQKVELQAHYLKGLEGQFDIIINGTASSLGGHGVPVDAQVMKPGALAYDMMYGASAKPFMDWARAHGAVPRDGLGMLVGQAAEAFNIWRGIMPPTKQVLDELRVHLG